jgi:hypothetical protein
MLEIYMLAFKHILQTQMFIYTVIPFSITGWISNCFVQGLGLVGNKGYGESASETYACKRSRFKLTSMAIHITIN